jgi:hypothetical protein
VTGNGRRTVLADEHIKALGLLWTDQERAVFLMKMRTVTIASNRLTLVSLR